MKFLGEVGNVCTFNALAVSHVMRYINLRYLLTYRLGSGGGTAVAVQ